MSEGRGISRLAVRQVCYHAYLGPDGDIFPDHVCFHFRCWTWRQDLEGTVILEKPIEGSEFILLGNLQQGKQPSAFSFLGSVQSESFKELKIWNIRSDRISISHQRRHLHLDLEFLPVSLIEDEEIPE